MNSINKNLLRALIDILRFNNNSHIPICGRDKALEVVKETINHMHEDSVTYLCGEERFQWIKETFFTLKKKN